jgi:acyl carrier protein
MTRTLEQIVEELLDLAATHFRIPKEQLAPDDDIFEKLRIDSLQALELLTRLEHHFGIELPDYEVQGVTSFRALAERIHARV